MALRTCALPSKAAHYTHELQLQFDTSSAIVYQHLKVALNSTILKFFFFFNQGKEDYLSELLAKINGRITPKTHTRLVATEKVTICLQPEEMHLMSAVVDLWTRAMGKERERKEKKRRKKKQHLL